MSANKCRVEVESQDLMTEALEAQVVSAGTFTSSSSHYAGYTAVTDVSISPTTHFSLLHIKIGRDG